MADERFTALATYLEKARPTQAGGYEGKYVTLRFVGEPAHAEHPCVLLGYDVVGVHVKETSGTGSGSPETQFYLWHMIASIKP